MGLTVDIEKRYGPFHLQISFAAGEGITGLLGASGSGKSLTLKCIAGIERPDSGHIELDGRVLFDSRRRINLPPQQRRMGYLFQNYALFPNMTVEQNIAAGVHKRNDRNQAVDRLIGAFQLEQSRGKSPGQLSGGQQQRVALARILASEPAALLLDEPFSALDSYLKWQVELELTECLAQFAGPVLFVTHDQEEIYRQCRQVCVLAHGTSQPVQSVKTLFNAPVTLSACRLSGCQNLSRARLSDDGRVEAVDWGLTLTPAGPLPQGVSYLGVWAHQIRLVQGPGPNRVHCQVLHVAEGRFSVTLLLATPAGNRGAALLRMEWEKRSLPPDGPPEQLWVELPPQHLLLLSGA